jgi:hypothetical protein
LPITQVFLSIHELWMKFCRSGVIHQFLSFSSRFLCDLKALFSFPLRSTFDDSSRVSRRSRTGGGSFFFLFVCPVQWAAGRAVLYRRNRVFRQMARAPFATTRTAVQFLWRGVFPCLSSIIFFSWRLTLGISLTRVKYPRVDAFSSRREMCEVANKGRSRLVSCLSSIEYMDCEWMMKQFLAWRYLASNEYILTLSFR